MNTNRFDDESRVELLITTIIDVKVNINFYITDLKSLFLNENSLAQYIKWKYFPKISFENCTFNHFTARTVDFQVVILRLQDS